ncbi:MAG: nucleotidyltransferase domain-containing protein [Candidatus Limnocylindrales bacterium]
MLDRLDAIRVRAEATPEIAGLIVLGSVAAGTADEESDLDLGLYVDDDAIAAFDLRAWLGSVHPVVAMFHTGHAWTAWFADLIRAEVHFGTLEASRDWTTMGGLICLPDIRRVVLLDRTGMLAARVAPLIAAAPNRGRDDAISEFLSLTDALMVADGRRRRGETAAAGARLAEAGTHLLRLACLAEGATADWVDPTRHLEGRLSAMTCRRFARLVEARRERAALGSALADAWSWALELRATLGIDVPDRAAVDAVDARLRRP